MSAAGNANKLDADTFDLELYRLVRRAEQFADDKNRPGRLRWADVAGRLRGARIHVRSMMSEEDLRRTS